VTPEAAPSAIQPAAPAAAAAAAPKDDAERDPSLPVDDAQYEDAPSDAVPIESQTGPVQVGGSFWEGCKR
jgi:hypothetical protein